MNYHGALARGLNTQRRSGFSQKHYYKVYG